MAFTPASSRGELMLDIGIDYALMVGDKDLLLGVFDSTNFQGLARQELTVISTPALLPRVIGIDVTALHESQQELEAEAGT